MRTRDMKKAEARERQRAYNALTNEERLAKLDRAGHRAVKQRLMLCEAIAGVRWE